MTEPSSRPGRAVLDAFGAIARLVALPLGQRTAWRSGDLVLKPLDGEVDALEWLDDVLSSARPSDRVRWTRPLRARTSGSLIVDGWTAWTYVEGEHDRNRWGDTIRAGEAFAELLERVDAPGFLKRRDDPWAIADRVAWGEASIDDLDRIPHVRRLRSVLTPVQATSQLVHGDLAGNVLFHPTLPPAVIDPSLYWRPASYASAIVVVDAMTFHGETASLLDALPASADFPQFLVRALLFRIVTDHLRGVPPRVPDPYDHVVDRICTRVIGS